MPALIDLSGERFGNLLVLGRDLQRHKRVHWLCACDCGGRSTVETSGLRSGHTKSCGCLKLLGNNTRHKMHNTPTYRSWAKMLSRCNNKNSDNYRYYGGRGISVCPSWHDFSNFYRDMGLRPAGMTLDRKNVDGDYAKENCCWATPTEQAQNRRNTVRITFNDLQMDLHAWANHTGISFTTLHGRFYRGWAAERMLSTPTRKAKPWQKAPQ